MVAFIHTPNIFRNIEIYCNLADLLKLKSYNNLSQSSQKHYLPLTKSLTNCASSVVRLAFFHSFYPLCIFPEDHQLFWRWFSLGFGRLLCRQSRVASSNTDGSSNVISSSSTQAPMGTRSDGHKSDWESSNLCQGPTDVHQFHGAKKHSIHRAT